MAKGEEEAAILGIVTNGIGYRSRLHRKANRGDKEGEGSGEQPISRAPYGGRYVTYSNLSRVYG